METTLRIEEPELTQEQQDIITSLMEHLGMTLEEAKDTIFSTELEDAPEPIKKFHVTDNNSANWVLKRIAEANAEIDEIHQMVDAEVDSIRRRAERILQPLQRKLEFFTNNFTQELEAWTILQLTGKKEKSISLIHGRVGIKSGSVHTEIIGDEAEIIAKLESLPIEQDPFVEDPNLYITDEQIELNKMLQEAVKISKSILKTPLKTALEKKGWDGTLPAGIDEEDGELVYVQVAKLERSPDTFYFTTEIPK